MVKEFFKKIYFYFFYLFFFKKFKYKNISFINNKNYFSQLCEKYNSDKCSSSFDALDKFNRPVHTYGIVYFNLFNHCRHDIKLVLEVGIGSTNSDILCNMTNNGTPGASLRVWRDFFPKAEVIGCDIDKNILFSDYRIKTFYVDQLKSETIRKLWSTINKSNFDIIIDDGLHNYEANINFFNHSYNQLKSGGVYIFEDVAYSYLKKLTKTLENKNINYEIINLNTIFKRYQDNNLIIVRKI